MTYTHLWEILAVGIKNRQKNTNCLPNSIPMTSTAMYNQEIHIIKRWIIAYEEDCHVTSVYMVRTAHSGD